MKTTSASLKTIMAGSSFQLAEIYTITTAAGTVLRYGDYDPALPVLVAGGNSFPTSGLKFKRTKTKQALGLTVSSTDVEIYADPNDATSYINGISFQSFVRGGGLDGATVRVEKCFMAVWGDCSTNGTLPWIYGLVGGIVAGRTSVKLTVEALTYLLNVQMPRDIYQPGCLNTLFDVNCTLVKSTFKVTGTVAAGSTITTINSGLANAAGYFDLGTVKFTSGVNNGLIRSIANYHDNGLAAGQFSIPLPLPVAPANGDTFDIFPGCDKTMGVCLAKFSNLTNFRGQPFVPAPETAQ